jgi:hypothetical protein
MLPTTALAAVCFVFAWDDTIFWIAYAALFLALATTLRALWSNAIALTLSVTVLLSTERIIIAAAASHLRHDQVNALLVVDEFVFPAVIAMGAAGYIRRWTSQPRLFQAIDVIILALGTVLLAAAAVGSAPLVERLIYARRFLVLPMTYVAGRVIYARPGDARRASALILAAAVAVATFGLVERFSPVGTIWGGIADPVAYYSLAAYSGAAASGVPGGTAQIDGLPHAFWSFEGGVQSRRLVSTFLEAPTLALFLALSLLLGIALALDARGSRRAILTAAVSVVAVALVLTLGKGGWVVATVGALYLLSARGWPWLASRTALLLMGTSMCTGLVVVATLSEVASVDSGLRMHLAGLKAGVDTALTNPLGLGLGSSGVFSSHPITGAGESMIGVLLAQTGWPGTLLWVLWLTAVGVTLALSTRSVTCLRWIGLAGGVATILVAAASALTESVGGLIGMWAFGFTAGLLLNVSSAWRSTAVRR